LKREAASKQKPGRPHSERAGRGLLASGARATLYRALVELTCSRCGGVIPEGALFTRDAEAFSGLPLVRLCRACAPFKASRGLLETLLEEPAGADSARAAAPASAKEKALERLAPALASRRRGTGVRRG
jgi:hypothetical protein